MEVGVRVEAEDMLTGNVVHVASAYLVFVATDERGKPVPIPPLIAETDDERRRMTAAETRRALRLHRPRTS
jgi:acyl-CoA hydrolase